MPYRLPYRRPAAAAAAAVVAAAVAVVFVVAGCSLDDPSNPIGDPAGEAPTDGPPGEAPAGVALVPAFDDVSFRRPVDLQHAGDGTGRLFVVEQEGVIRVLPTADASDAPVVLDIRDRVNDRGNEEGLLGLAFHPDFETNGTFFVNYTAADPRRSVLARYRMDSPVANRASAATETVLLEVEQPFSNHNGGGLAFGPDGYLYVALGDGGSAGDPRENGQDPNTLLGAILRLDVDAEAGGRAYGIPPDNPFADGGGRPEIYAYGLRNPWRFSFDAETGELWAGDVGQNRYEEIDRIERGGNYGWDVVEGRSCFEPEDACGASRFAAPVHVYPHDEGRSVTGGFVYRGGDVPALAGRYVFADYVSGRIWALTPDADAPPDELFDTNLGIASFGVDEAGELYLTAFDGNVYRFVAD